MSTDRHLCKHKYKFQYRKPAAKCFKINYKGKNISAQVWRSSQAKHAGRVWEQCIQCRYLYLGVRISLYCSFSTLVVAATDMGITMLLMSKELSPRLLLMGCCWGGGGQRDTWTRRMRLNMDVYSLQKMYTITHVIQSSKTATTRMTHMTTGFNQHFCDNVSTTFRRLNLRRCSFFAGRAKN